MQRVLKTLEEINSALNQVLWGPPMLALIILTGLYFSVKTRFLQITRLRMWMRLTLFSLFDKEVRKSRDKHAISQFQSFATALAGTAGIGNIAGVATALVAGGPGSLFWMWVSALVGMIIIYAENVLGIHFRYRGKNGAWVGGPMVYIERGLNMKWLAVVFSALCVCASLGMGNMTQSNAIAGALYTVAGVPLPLSALLTGAALSLVILGGLKRIAAVTEKLVPFMVIVYCAGGIALIVVNIQRLPGVLENIFSGAFSLRAASGGVMGYGIARAMRFGIARGIFSNEAGLGSSVIVHAASDIKEPVRQGMWGIFEVFADTVVMCSITGLAVLMSGAYGSGKDGVALTIAAFESAFGRAGGLFVCISTVLFAFSSMVGWSYYGECGLKYLVGDRLGFLYRALYILFAAVGGMLELGLVWELSDTLNGLMMLPNMIAVLLLSGTVVRITRDYFGLSAGTSKCAAPRKGGLTP